MVSPSAGAVPLPEAATPRWYLVLTAPDRAPAFKEEVRMQTRPGLILGVVLAATWPACATTKENPRATTGGAVGAATGGIVGAAIGHRFKHTGAGAIFGAVVGGAAGVAIGNYMDDQARELEKIEGARVERVGEGIKVTFDSAILFDTDSATLRGPAREGVQKLADVLQKYPDTRVIVEGHTDSTGTAAHNEALSERRARAVERHAAEIGVDPDRLRAVGLGEEAPVASNASAYGRQANRRVEIAIFANEALRQAALERKPLRVADTPRKRM
jgi:outer membrane protein OmpA-like peptidoglycan-associated protein